MKLLLPVLLLLLAACAGPTRQDTDPDERAPDFGQPGEPGYHLLMAETAMQRNRPALAATEYLRAALGSDDPEVAERAARITSAYGTTAEALRAAKRWAELAPEALHPPRFLARLYLQAGEWEQAVPEIARLRRAAGEAERAFLPLLPLATGARDRDGAAAAMGAVAADYPDDASGAYAHAYLALRAGDVTLALAEGQRALALDPDWTDAAILYARAIMADGRPDEALDWLATWPGAGESRISVERAIMLMGAGRDEEARFLLHELLDAVPNDPEALRALGYLEYFSGYFDEAREALMALLATGRHTDDALFYLGGIAEQQGEIEEAARLYSRITGGEHRVTAQVRLALLMYRMGRPELAIQHLELFAERNPDADIELGVARAELLGRLGMPDDALRVYDELLERHPDETGLRYARGLLHVELEQVEAALQDFGRIVEQHPDDPVALNAFGYTLTDLTDRHQEAYPLIRRALELDPDNPAILDSMGWVLFRLGRPQEALPYIERSMALYRDPEVAAHLGEILWSLGRVDEAREVWLEAIVEFPGSAILLDTMGRLDP
jgi:tetratricopeptide (TPR) repeat protein